MSAIKTATDARVHFGELIEHEDGYHTTQVVEIDGEPQAVLLSPGRRSELEDPADVDWEDGAAQSRKIIAKFLAGRVLPDIEDLVNGGRDDVD